MLKLSASTYVSLDHPCISQGIFRNSDYVSLRNSNHGHALMINCYKLLGNTLLG